MKERNGMLSRVSDCGKAVHVVDHEGQSYLFACYVGWYMKFLISISLAMFPDNSEIQKSTVENCIPVVFDYILTISDVPCIHTC